MEEENVYGKEDLSIAYSFLVSWASAAMTKIKVAPAW